MGPFMKQPILRWSERRSQILRLDYAGSESLLARFEREILVFAAVNHPHICFAIGFRRT